jgi:hypothetical protein
MLGQLVSRFRFYRLQDKLLCTLVSGAPSAGLQSTLVSEFQLPNLCLWEGGLDDSILITFIHIGMHGQA